MNSFSILLLNNTVIKIFLFLFIQVTPGANTDGDLSTSRTSEPALLTPLTPSSRDTPSDDGTKNEVVNFSFDSPQHFASFSDSPSSPVDRNLLLQWPFQSEEPFTTPPSVLVDVDADLGLVEGLQWETTTPSLPQRRVARTGLTSEGKSSVVSTMSNDLHSPVFDRMSSPLPVNSLQRPEQTSWVPGSSQTPAGLGGLGQQGELRTYNLHISFLVTRRIGPSFFNESLAL